LSNANRVEKANETEILLQRREKARIAARRRAVVIIFLIVGIVTAFGLQARAAEIVCAEDIAPSDMVVTATGTSSVCRGSCRARKLELVRGPIMIICAQQPVPKGYVLDSITTSPSCRCLGDEDNAYAIRRGEMELGEATPIATPSPSPLPELFHQNPDFRIGD